MLLPSERDCVSAAYNVDIQPAQDMCDRGGIDDTADAGNVVVPYNSCGLILIFVLLKGRVCAREASWLRI